MPSAEIGGAWVTEQGLVLAQNPAQRRFIDRPARQLLAQGDSSPKICKVERCQQQREH